MATAPRLPDLAACSADELRTLVIGLLEANAKLEAAVATQAEEIARLKGLQVRPQIKPSGMEKGTDPAAGAASGDSTTGKKRRRQRKRDPNMTVAALIIYIKYQVGEKVRWCGSIGLRARLNARSETCHQPLFPKLHSVALPHGLHIPHHAVQRHCPAHWYGALVTPDGGWFRRAAATVPPCAFEPERAI